MSSACPKCGLVSETLLPSGLCSTCHGQELQPTAAWSDAPPDHDTTATHTGPAASTPAFGYGAANGLPRCAGYRFAEADLLGEGGMGRVYKAVQVSSGMTVAVKLLRADAAAPSILRRFAGEAASLARLRHPNVVGLHDFVRDTPEPFLVMEFVDGLPLSKYADKRSLDPTEAARLVSAAARGVHAANLEGIYHRDLKPSNLLRAADGAVKVADFGLCKREDHDETVTQTGHLAGGTPGFMAPEQADPAAGECDARTDVWGLGATLYALLVGKPPFPTGSKNALKVLSEPYVSPRQVNPAIPRELDAIVSKCLERERGQRYPTAAAVADDLNNWLEGKPTVARPVGWLGRQWKRLRRVSKAVVVAWSLAVVAAVVTVTLARPPKTAPTVDPLAERQAELRAGREVVLVDNGRFLLEPKWLLGDAVLVGPTDEEPFTSFASRDKVMLTVLPDPGVDRYRITARVSQRPVTPDVVSAVPKIGALLGVFWGYREVEFQDGVKVKAHMALAYNDYQPAPAKPRATHLAFFDMGQVENPADPLNPLPIPTSKMGPNAPLGFVPALPGPFRTLVVEVTPDRVAFETPTGWVTLRRADLDAQCDDLEHGLRESCGGRVLGTQAWSPRSPVGLFVDRSRIAIERFVITPLPE